jgi:plasmid stabilization system protein ParE
MAHRVAWSRRALQDLETISEYIAEDSLAYTAVVVKNIVQQTRQLSRFPQQDEILISALIHGKRIVQ